MSTTYERRRAAAVEFLVEHGADREPHLFGDLLSHLTGVEDLVRRWGDTDLLALAALGHATYGTDGFEPHILELSDRAVLAETIGPEAEDLVYFYASCDRDAFYPQLEDPDSGFEDLSFRDRFTGIERVPPPDSVTRRRRPAVQPNGRGWPSSAASPTAGPLRISLPGRPRCFRWTGEDPDRTSPPNPYADPSWLPDRSP